MTDPLSTDDLDAMIARDQAAGDGLSLPDHQVFTDRHHLLTEVIRQREVINRLRSGLPSPHG